MSNECRITSVRAVLLSHAYAEGSELRWVGGVIRSWDAALVEVTLDDGTTGIGEAGAGIMAAAAVPGIVEALAPYAPGEYAHPLDVGDALRARTAFWSRGGLIAGVIGAIEIAAVDATAKRQEVPAYELLGGARRNSIEVYASGGLGTTFDDIIHWADMQTEAGFRTVKFRAMRDPEVTRQLLAAVVPSLADGTSFVLDAVQGCASRPWSHDDALAVGHEAARFGARWYEEPCFADDVAGYARMSAELDVPVSGVESHARVEDFQALIQAGGVAIAQPDATFVGGFRSFAEVAEIGAAHAVGVVPHVWGSGVTLAANLHASFASPYVELFEYCTLPNPLRDALAVGLPQQSESRLARPDTVGLGVELTPEIEARFPFQNGGGHVIS